MQHDTLSLAQNHLAGLLPDYSEMMAEVNQIHPEFCLRREARFLGKNRERYNPTQEQEDNKQCLLCHKVVQKMDCHLKDGKHRLTKKEYPVQRWQDGKGECETCDLFSIIDGEGAQEYHAGPKNPTHQKSCRAMYNRQLTCPFCLKAPIHW